MIAAIKDIYDLPRWVLSAVVVIGIHAAFTLIVTRWHEVIEGDGGSEAVVVDLAPITSQQSQTKDDLAPGPLQAQSDATPQVERPQPEQQPEEKAEPPPLPDAEVQLPQKPVAPPEKPKEQQKTAVLETTAPPKPRPSAAQIASWHRKVALQLERHKRYPLAARSRRETGTAVLAFTIDRHGRVASSRIVRTSGAAALDQETLDTVKRAQPFPAPPPNMRGETFQFTVPIRFNIRERK